MNDRRQPAQVQAIETGAKRTTGWWGMVALIATEGSLFGYLLFTYFYLGSQTEQQWPPDGLPILLIPTMNTLVLLASSLCVWLCEQAISHKRMRLGITMIAMAVILGSCFVDIQLNEWKKKSFDISTDLYGSLYFTITGFHLLHVLIGVVILTVLLLWMALNYVDHKNYSAVTIGGMYWHFVDVVWLFVFTSLYLYPYL